MTSPLAISWVLSDVSGYGVYGLQILLHYLRRGGVPERFILTKTPLAAGLPSKIEEKVRPVFELASRLQEFMQKNPLEQLHFKHAVLHAVSNDFRGFEGQDNVWGQPNVGCAAIEHLEMSPHGLRIAKNYDMFVAISRWNAAYLRSLNVAPVHLCHQGVDRGLFYPAPRTGRYGDRFILFSGGKFEFRKGQDIVVAAFKRFYKTHRDALLITCWQNLIQAEAVPFILAKHIEDVPEQAEDKSMMIKSWLLKQGLPEESFIDLPFTSHMFMPPILHECDMAIFPNRCEGGTNLVAMEAMACGVPTYVSYNTGHKDLVDLMGAYPFHCQGPVTASSDMRSVQDWGETDIDEVVAAMEYVYHNRQKAKYEMVAVTKQMDQWDWRILNEKLLHVTCSEEAITNE